MSKAAAVFRPAVLVALLSMLAFFLGTPAATATPSLGPVAALPPPTNTVAPAPAIRTAGLEDFSFDRFHADYTLGRDSEGRSTLTMIEQFDVRFPDFDQNRGFVREIPQIYDNHSVEVTVQSVVDDQGNARPSELTDMGDSLWLTMAVPEGQFVRGKQTYIIEYTIRDVTRFFEDTGVDEFYWDLNGTEWSQPFGEVSATVTFADDLAASLTGDAACYRGELGSDTACDITRTGDSFAVSERTLGPGENVTLAVAFEPDTFTPAPEENYFAEPGTSSGSGTWGRPPNTPLYHALNPGGQPVLLCGALLSFVSAIGLFVTNLVRGRSAGRTGRAIIAQYDPPAGVPVAVAAEILKESSKTTTATLLDFAVRGKVRLVHDEPSDVYGVQSLTDDGLDDIDAKFYTSLFGFGSPAGTMLWFDRKSTKLGDAANTLASNARVEAKRDGYVEKQRAGSMVWVAVLLVLTLALPAVYAIVAGRFGLLTVILAVGVQVLFWTLIGLFTLTGQRRTLTEKGGLLRDYLLGLREYIRLAEADRIRMLQSVSGAEVDEHRIVQVYERLLPYAVLFGQEKEWQRELSRYYRDASPAWVAGDSSFTTTLAFSALHHAVASEPVTRSTSSYGSGSGSGGSFSSFSGGSSGGGFSGGGGGGGGGHGI